MSYPPTPTVKRLWNDDNESVMGAIEGNKWRIRDLRSVVQNEKPFDLPLGLFNFREHEFEAKDLYEFAQHMLHVQESDLQYPVIMDQRGRVVDGRHRIVKALLEGKESVKCVKIPDGAIPTE